MKINETRYETVADDLYFIASRIKEIDASYRIVRNRKSGRLEVHSLAQIGSSYALTLPYDRLDERTLRYVRRTGRERAEALRREMDEENAKTAKAARQACADAVAVQAERVLREGKCK